MQIIYTGEEMPEHFTKSLFLAGPSLRPGQEKEMESWRQDALQILEDKGYDGIVFCPENKDNKFEKDFNYDDQVDWEDKYLNLCDCVLFWIPRDLSLDKEGNLKLPAFTTNIEFGTWASSGKTVFGCPEDAEKVDYLKYYCEKYNTPMGSSLVETIDNALEMLGEGAERTGGERYVPLFVWKQESFQSWYQAQTDTGNRLEDAKLLYTFRPKYKSFVFLWVLKVNVYIESEKRYKDNEFVLSRPDISSICMWNKDTSEVVLIKEFRSPSSTEDGFIRELPSGSSSHKGDPKETASEEVLEETGFYLAPIRLQFHQERQLMGTLSAHKSFLYSVELTDKEIEWFKSQDGVAYGKEEDTERTFIEVVSVKDLLKNKLTDWATLGQILYIVLNQDV